MTFLHKSSQKTSMRLIISTLITGSLSLFAFSAHQPLTKQIPKIVGHRITVHGSYKVSANFAYAPRLGAYGTKRSLVIDPTLPLSSTYLGGILAMTWQPPSQWIPPVIPTVRDAAKA